MVFQAISSCVTMIETNQNNETVNGKCCLSPAEDKEIKKCKLEISNLKKENQNLIHENRNWKQQRTISSAKSFLKEMNEEYIYIYINIVTS